VEGAFISEMVPAEEPSGDPWLAFVSSIAGRDSGTDEGNDALPSRPGESGDPAAPIVQETTPMNTTNNYPFTTKSSIKSQLDTSPEYRREVMVLLYQLQTYHEKSTNSTLVRNRVGFMSSHAVNGSKIAKKLLAGETLTDEETAKMDAIAPRYSRQLAVHYRTEMMAKNPELARIAKLFSANNGVEAPEVTEAEVVEADTEVTSDETADTEV
jgi:hypothetical protein